MRLQKPKLQVWVPKDADEATVVQVENSDLFRQATMRANGEVVDDPFVWQFTLGWLAAKRLGLIDKAMPLEAFVDECDVAFGGVDEVDPTNPEPTSD